MSKFLKWIRCHKMIAAILILIIGLMPPIIANCLFKWYAGITFLIAEWSAGDLLGYCANFLTLISTVFLGYVAIKQTEYANDMANKSNMMNKSMLEIQKSNDLFHRQPSIMIYDCEMQLISYSRCIADKDSTYYYCKGFQSNNKKPDQFEDICLITFYIINSSNIFLEARLVNVTSEYGDAALSISSAKESCINARKSTIHLAPEKTSKIQFMLHRKYYGGLSGKRGVMKLILINSAGEKYKELIEFVVEHNYEGYLYLITPNYSIIPINN